ncbi:unnamed protein product [Prunus armeniaca]|uniref:Uncharacterized protein n=1 Tax=Prunus armeniaca TaxID=36596 RepID=A0A6J5TYX3_PRUAR|nr:unnamed protein product [Prunus armeniaca]
MAARRLLSWLEDCSGFSFGPHVCHVAHYTIAVTYITYPQMLYWRRLIRAPMQIILSVALFTLPFSWSPAPRPSPPAYVPRFGPPRSHPFIFRHCASLIAPGDASRGARSRLRRYPVTNCGGYP